MKTFGLGRQQMDLRKQCDSKKYNLNYWKCFDGVLDNVSYIVHQILEVLLKNRSLATDQLCARANEMTTEARRPISKGRWGGRPTNLVVSWQHKDCKVTLLIEVYFVKYE